jgi:uncharacterized protein (DUF362 family)
MRMRRAFAALTGAAGARGGLGGRDPIDAVRCCPRRPGFGAEVGQMAAGDPPRLTRRELITGAVGIGVLTCAAPAAKTAPPRARVAIARHGGVWSDPAAPNPAITADLVARAVEAAIGAPDAVAGLRSLFRPSDVVGIKVNCLAGRGLSTHRPLVEALSALLVRAGVGAESIIVWDRSDRDLTRAGFSVRRSGVGPRCYGTNDDYENEPIEARSVGGCLTRILTRELTAVINVPILKDHDLAGISGALKSFYGAIHNPNKYHDGGCAPYVADLYARPEIRDKVRFTVLDALRPQCHGGPAYVPEHTWPMGAVLASTDPVAIDAVATRLIATERQRRGMESLAQAGRKPAWLETAVGLGLGVADPARIDEVQR